MTLNPWNILIPRAYPEEFFNGIPFEEEHPQEEEQNLTKEKTNVFLFNFCQSSQFSKKIKIHATDLARREGQRIVHNPDGSVNLEGSLMFQPPQQQNMKYPEICFMPPERIMGKIDSEKPNYLEVCKRSDIWSVGVILYLLFAGHLPFKGETCLQLYESIKKSEFMFSGH